MQVKTVIDFLGIPKGSIGYVTDREGKILEGESLRKSMWIKFECKDMPVGIPQDFSKFVTFI